MPGLNYEREFHFEPWADGVDRVAATGDSGFNVRFAALEAEFDKVSEAPLGAASVRTGNLDVISGTAVTRTIASGGSTEIAGPDVTMVPPQVWLPLLAVSTTTQNALFSVTTAYRTTTVPAQLKVVFQVQNLGGTSVTITGTPCLVRA